MKKLTTEEFIKKSIIKHGDLFDYSKTVYINSRTKVIITCPKHGDFTQLAKGHLVGYGCSECAGNKPITIKTFIKKAKDVHLNKFDYSKSIYKNNKTKLIIICPTHGEFEQFPQDHLNGNGCNECRLNKSIENTYIPNKKELREYSI